MSDYKRLTQWTENGASLILDNPQNENEARKQLMQKFKIACNKLAEYEDDEESGKIVRLPCKVGDTVYIACDWDINEVVEGVVSEIEYTVNARGFYFRIYVDHKYIFSKTNPNVVKHRYIFMQEEIFLTREEAEKRLKELQGDKE